MSGGDAARSEDYGWLADVDCLELDDDVVVNKDTRPPPSALQSCTSTSTSSVTKAFDASASKINSNNAVNTNNSRPTTTTTLLPPRNPVTTSTSTTSNTSKSTANSNTPSSLCQSTPKIVSTKTPLLPPRTPLLSRPLSTPPGIVPASTNSNTGQNVVSAAKVPLLPPPSQRNITSTNVCATPLARQSRSNELPTDPITPQVRQEPPLLPKSNPQQKPMTPLLQQKSLSRQSHSQPPSSNNDTMPSPSLPERRNSPPPQAHSSQPLLQQVPRSPLYTGKLNPTASSQDSRSINQNVTTTSKSTNSTVSTIPCPPSSKRPRIATPPSSDNSNDQDESNDASQSQQPPTIPGPAGHLGTNTSRLSQLDPHIQPSAANSILYQSKLKASPSPASAVERISFHHGAWVQFLKEFELPPFGRHQLHYNIRYVLTQGYKKKVPSLCVVLCSIVQEERNLKVWVKDPSGQMEGTILGKLLDNSHIRIGCVLILNKVSVFNPSPSTHYLSIVGDNIERVIADDTSVSPDDERVSHSNT
ncbi:hypothetical protein Pelo_1569 [Pelomyxa schiedti]|nr:hypothetical protein Pelo_1569 [Pelomyxa schiedti]